MLKFYILLIISVNSIFSFTQESYDKHTRINSEKENAAIPSYPDLFFEYRIAELNKNTPPWVRQQLLPSELQLMAKK